MQGHEGTREIIKGYTRKPKKKGNQAKSGKEAGQLSET